MKLLLYLLVHSQVFPDARDELKKEIMLLYVCVYCVDDGTSQKELKLLSS